MGAAGVDLDAIEAGEGLLELDPPEARRAIGEVRRHIGDEGAAVAFENGQREIDEVAVAVVEGQRHKGRLPWIGRRDRLKRLIEGQEAVAAPAQMTKKRVEELGTDLQPAVGRELSSWLGRTWWKVRIAPSPRVKGAASQCAPLARNSPIPASMTFSRQPGMNVHSAAGIAALAILEGYS